MKTLTILLLLFAGFGAGFGGLTWWQSGGWLVTGGVMGDSEHFETIMDMEACHMHLNEGYEAGLEEGMRILSDEIGDLVAAGEIEEPRAEKILMAYWPPKRTLSEEPDTFVSPDER